MNPFGFCRNLSSELASHVTLAFFIPGEKLNPGTVALWLPTIPASEGPILLTPGLAEWHAAQRLKRALPAVASAVGAALDTLSGKIAHANTSAAPVGNKKRRVKT